MGDTMREAFEALYGPRPTNDSAAHFRNRWHELFMAFKQGHEAGRQLGMEQARREERERIAQLVDPIANDIAAAIRNS